MFAAVLYAVIHVELQRFATMSGAFIMNETSAGSGSGVK
jgi:hypothetical protein